MQFSFLNDAPLTWLKYGRFFFNTRSSCVNAAKRSWNNLIKYSLIRKKASANSERLFHQINRKVCV